MQRRRFVLGCGCAALGGLPWAGALAQAEAPEWKMPARFARPDASSDEGSLWAFMDREEHRLKQSAFVIRDKALQDYVTGIVCKLAGEHCPDIRVYIVQTPLFNASMAPNGMMQVWSGLLLRMTSEAQLAAVLGHEIGHYLARHSIERLRDAKSKSAAGQFLGILLARAGGLGAISQLALLAGMLAYSRDQEREADRIGVELMARAGYAPLEASRVWEQLLEELKAGAKDRDEYWDESVLFKTHPPAAERQKVLADLAAAKGAQGRTGADEYRAALAQHRSDFLVDELKRHNFGETRVLLERMQKAFPDDGELQYCLGEAYRLRAQDKDLTEAIAAYRRAELLKGAPAEMYRSMGLVQRKLGDEGQAESAFAKYLELKPTAPDSALIRTYLKRTD
ncbi:MAG TPA: M48 family metallopeptidase [Burkholderiales bacterium]|nr:M48 family metallopeptidase [Burkholderiales bacterium]